MSILFLCNDLGHNASAEGEAGISGSTVATGYDRTDLIAGPRSTLFRLEAATAEKGVGFQLTSDLTVTHMIIARADYLVTTGGMRVRGRQRNNLGTWAYITGIDYNTLDSSDLTGLYSQDLITTVSQDDYRGFGISTDSASGTAEAAQLSKLFFSNAFDMGVSPEPGVSWEPLPARTYVRPLYSYLDYEVEAKITLTWNFVTAAKLSAFRALPQIFNWPLFLYDEDADLWSYELEHVIVENVSERLITNDAWQIAITFDRLKHYP